MEESDTPRTTTRLRTGQLFGAVAGVLVAGLLQGVLLMTVGRTANEPRPAVHPGRAATFAPFWREASSSPSPRAAAGAAVLLCFRGASAPA